ncbi:integrin alpha-2 isoform X2 [Stegostoma tigrinum]|uniref:integrin alpha-2 isoform X2 n=1 Tax=Stegostoma tigrinum TaxID=3053191 RepID=UPI00286FD6B1|nr:integrin alpha-2 isoform X2 [Stegostoma tigrinum]
MGSNRRGIISLLLLVQGNLLLQTSQAFNVDMLGAKTFSGPRDAQFGTSIQQYSNSDGKWLLIGSPWTGFPENRTGDVYKCPINGNNEVCEKLNLGDIMTFPNVTEDKQDMNTGSTLIRNDKTGGFLTCAPLWAQKCGNMNYPRGLCADIKPNFQVSKTFSPAVQRCGSYMDLVIVLDGSNSIWPWVPVQNFLKKLTGSLDIGPEKTQVSIVQYGEDVRFEFKLNTYKTTAEVEQIAAKIKQKQGTETNTARGINFAREYAFSTQNGGRLRATKVMVVVTDGESHDSANLPRAIIECEKEHIVRFGIAVLGYYNREGINPDNLIKEIKSIASDPKEKHFFNVSSEAALIEIASALRERIIGIEGTSNKNEDTFQLEMAQVGFSAHFVPSQDLLMLGAVGAYDWAGTTVHKSSDKITIFAKKVFQDILQDKNDSSYLGYSVASLVTKYSVLYVAGAPRFQHTGQIVIYTVGLNDEVVIKQTAKGEQLGSYFGSVLCSIDVDRDSLTDVLLVGSPMLMGKHKNEEGRVYVFSVNQQGSLEKKGTLEGPVDGKNTRFGAAIAAIADINLDGYNDVAVGAPVEDEQHGVVYIYNGHQTSILSKHTQKIQASKISPQLKYFGFSIDGQKDLNGDTITDLSIGSIGNVVQLWSRNIANVKFTVIFEPNKLSILNKTCQINENWLTCGKVKICFQATVKPENSVSSINIRYNATFDMSLKSSHATSRALFQTNHMREIQNDISVDKVQKCNTFSFYVNEKIDNVSPLSLRLDFAAQDTEVGPSLDAHTTRSKEFFIPFSKDCGDDEECITDLAIEVHSNIPNNSNYIVSSKKQQMTINVETENKKENAFNAKVIVHFSDNIFFASAENSDCSEVNSTSVSCDIGSPFLKGGDKTSFDINFDFNVNKPQRNAYVRFFAESESHESPETYFDNKANVIFTVQYDTEILFSRTTNKHFYEITSKMPVNKTRPPLDQIGPEYVITLIVNTGHFPIQTTYVTVNIPVSTKKDNRLLYLVDVTQSNNIICDAKLDTLDVTNYHSTTFNKESFRSFSDLNCDNVKCENFLCTINNLKMNNQYTIKIVMRIWLDTFINADFQRITLTSLAQIDTRNPLLIIDSNTLTTPVEISRPMKEEVPIGVIVGSVIGGLLVLLALTTALWKLGFFKRKYNKLEKDEEDNENNGDQDVEEE